MLNNSDFEISGSLNDAFELIKSIFDKERKSYEKTILSMKNRITELEEALIKANKENMKYQTKISNLKRKLTSISKTVSKLEDSDFDLKNEKKETEKNDFITNRENCHNNIKYRNKEKMNSFRKKTKFMSNINRSASDNCNQFMKTNFVDINNTKQRTKDILKKESNRGNITLAIYIVYLVVIASAYAFFFLKKEMFELIVSIILFFAVPGLLILEGYNAKFFFFWGFFFVGLALFHYLFK